MLNQASRNYRKSIFASLLEPYGYEAPPPPHPAPQETTSVSFDSIALKADIVQYFAGEYLDACEETVISMTSRPVKQQ